jgi:hypothetical protein
VAHANDRAKPSQYVLVSAALMFCFSLGAMAGPIVSSSVVALYGPAALFSYTSVVHGVLIILTLWRMRARESVPTEGRGGFIMLLRTSPALAKLVRNAPAENDAASTHSTNPDDGDKDLSA